MVHRAIECVPYRYFHADILQEALAKITCVTAQRAVHGKQLRPACSRSFTASLSALRQLRAQAAQLRFECLYAF